MDIFDAQSIVNPVSVPCTNVSHEALGPDTTRQSMLLCSHPTVNITYNWKSTVVAGTGVYLPAGAPPVMITKDKVGTAIKEPLFAIMSANNATPAAIIVWQCPTEY